MHFLCVRLEDLHNNAFAFVTLHYCMSLNNSAFIYGERRNSVTPKHGGLLSFAD